MWVYKLNYPRALVVGFSAKASCIPEMRETKNRTVLVERISSRYLFENVKYPDPNVGMLYALDCLEPFRFRNV